MHFGVEICQGIFVVRAQQVRLEKQFGGNVFGFVSGIGYENSRVQGQAGKLSKLKQLLRNGQT